jgi:tRNA A-37 threonylcarbamoyl transferase component Bud32
VSVRAGSWTFAVSPELADTAFARFCGLPAGECPDGVSPVVSSVNTEVRRFEYGGRGYFLKEYFFLGWKKHLQISRRGERLLRIARQIGEHGFLTPRVVATGRCGKGRRVVTEAVEEARDIWQVLFPDFIHYRGDMDDGFVHALGCTIGNFHRCGFFHGDLRWRNVLARRGGDGWKFYFIDNDRTARFPLGIPLYCRVKNLSQILFSGLLVGWPERDWQEFLRGYLASSGLRHSARGPLVARVEEKARKRLLARRDRRCAE